MRLIRDESASVLVVAVLIIFGLILFQYAVIQYLFNVRDGLRNHYTSLSAAQQMQNNFPYPAAAQRAGALVAQLAGYSATKGDLDLSNVEQSTAGKGTVKIHTDTSTVPYTAMVTITKELSYLEGFFAGMGTSGLSSTITTSDMGATSFNAYLAMLTDMSSSMRSGFPSGNVWLYDNLVEAAGLKLANLANPDDKNDLPHALCWPLSIEDCDDAGFVPPEAVNKATFDISNPVHTGGLRACCLDMAKSLPGALPIRGHTNQTVGYFLNNPLQNQNPEATAFEGSEGTYADRPWRVFNPDIDYVALGEPGEFLTLQGNQQNVVDFSHPLSCVISIMLPYIPYPPATDQIKYMLMNHGGARLVDYDIQAEPVTVSDSQGHTFQVHPISCSTEEECAMIRNPAGNDAPIDIDTYAKWQYTSGWNMSDQHLCSAAFRQDEYWLTEEELSYCLPVQGYWGPENGGGGGCYSQDLFLSQIGHDIFVTYKRLTQSFLIAVSELVQSIYFGAFSGPTKFGNVSDLASNGSGGWERLSGVVDLFDGNDTFPPSHIFTTPVKLKDLAYVDIQHSADASEANRERNIIINPTLVREMEMMAYLDGSRFPNLYPSTTLHSSNREDPNYNYWSEREEKTGKDPRTAFPRSNAFLAYKNWLAPLEHPGQNKGWPITGVADADGMPGRTISNELALPLASRWHWTSEFQIYHGGDVGFADNIIPRQYFPVTGAMDFNEAAVDQSWINTSVEPHRGIYDSPSLRAINPLTGSQTGDAYTYEKVQDFATSAFAHAFTTLGGTDTWGAFMRVRKGCAKHKSLFGANAPCISVLVTDGKPDLTTDPTGVGGLANILPWTSDPIPFNTHMQNIKDELTALEALGNTLTIILFIEQDSPDAEATTFLDLFRCPSPPCADNPDPNRRVLLRFNYGSKEEFRDNFQEALTTVIMLIRASSLLTEVS